MPGLQEPTAQEKRLAILVFAGLVVASLLVNSAWTNSWKVTPPAVSKGDTYETAVYRKMAYQGDAGAMHLLGNVYFAGTVVKQDSVEAHRWFNLAASRTFTENYPIYAAQRDVTSRSMTPRQVADAQKRAREWLAAFEKRANTTRSTQ